MPLTHGTERKVKMMDDSRKLRITIELLENNVDNVIKDEYGYEICKISPRTIKNAIELLKKYQNIIYCEGCQFAQMTPVSYPQYWCVKKNNYMDGRHFCMDGKRKNETY